MRRSVFFIYQLNNSDIYRFLLAKLKNNQYLYKLNINN